MLLGKRERSAKHLDFGEERFGLAWLLPPPLPFSSPLFLEACRLAAEGENEKGKRGRLPARSEGITAMPRCPPGFPWRVGRNCPYLGEGECSRAEVSLLFYLQFSLP